LKVQLQWTANALWQYGDSFAHPLAVPHRDLAVAKVDILHAKPEAFEQAQPAAVKQFAHELVGASELIEDGSRFRAGEDDGDLRRPFDAFHVIQEIEFPFQDLLVEEKQCTQGLVLSGGRYVQVDGKVSEKGGNFIFAHLVWMAFLMEEDVAANPIDVRLFGPKAVVLDAQMPAHAIE